MALTLTTDERTELERRVRSLKIRSEDARRARVILMLANGDSYSTSEATVPCFRDYINRWPRRSPAGRSGLAFYRRGPLSCCGGLTAQSGEVLGQAVRRHTSAPSVDFPREIVAGAPERREIHVSADIRSTHQTQAAPTFLLAHPKV